MPSYGYPLLLLAGFVAGFVNTLAGSGSLVTLPALLFLGLPATVANGTNRVAILLQNVVAVASFRHQRVFRLKEGLGFAVPAVVGALAGALVAVELDDASMRRVIGAVMLLMAINLAFRPKRWLEPRSAGGGRAMTALLLFFAGVYGGFIQAGVGFLLIAALVLGSGLDLLKGNAIKVLTVLCLTLPALGIFAWHGLVDWRLGAVLGVGNMAGAYLASRMAVERGVEFLRWSLLLVAIAAGIAFLIGF